MKCKINLSYSGPKCEDGNPPSTVDPDTTDDYTETIDDQPDGGSTITLTDDDSTTDDKTPMELTFTVTPTEDGEGNPPTVTVTVTDEDGNVVEIPSDNVSTHF